MHIKHPIPGVLKTMLMAVWLVLAWLCCTAAWAAPSASVVASPSSAVAPANVTLSVAVTADPDPVTVTRVQYVNGNSSLGVVTTAPFSLNLPNLGPGYYVIKAYVTLADGQNTMLTSTPVALTITGGTAASAAVYYIHTDQLNTPRVIADKSQAVVWKWESDGFGSMPPNEQPGTAPAFEFNPRFAGQYFDRESNLHYNYYRDYDPQTGRYVQSDPIGLRGGINTYGYVANNPVGYTDPFGLMCVSGNGFTTCFGAGGPTFRVPTPPGFPQSMGPGDDFYHAYDVQRDLNGADSSCVIEGMMQAPTPGSPSPALPQGTRNNAVVGGVDNWVTSYRTNDLVTGALVEVNIAGVGDGSLFGPGYVARYVRDGVAHTAGEGTNWKQSPAVTSHAVQSAANEALWGRQMSKIIESAKKCGCKQ